MTIRPTNSVARILIIAGSDSGGGAGIQADIKTVTLLGGHAMTAITAITAQNTLGVTGVHAVPAEMVIAQIDAVVSDLGVDAIKIGMIGSAEIVEAVADRLDAPDLATVPVVLICSVELLVACAIEPLPAALALSTLKNPSLSVVPPL